MKLLNKINDNAHQKFFLTGNPGQRIILVLRYLASQQMWMADIEWGEFVLNGILVTASPNMLRNYKNLIPFGLACTVVDGLDPYYIDDFDKGRASLFLLSAAEVQAIEEAMFV